MPPHPNPVQRGNWLCWSQTYLGLLLSAWGERAGVRNLPLWGWSSSWWGERQRSGIVRCLLILQSWCCFLQLDPGLKKWRVHSSAEACLLSGNQNCSCVATGDEEPQIMIVQCSHHHIDVLWYEGNQLHSNVSHESASEHLGRYNHMCRHTLKLVKLPNENYKDKLCHTVQNFSQHRYMFPHAEGHIRKLYHPIFTKVRSCSDVKSEKCDRWQCDYGVTCDQSLLDASPLFHILPQYKYALSIMLTPQNALLSSYSLSLVWY